MRSVTGLDIGTGASAIYPLLGLTARPTWRFAATEIDTKSYGYAKKNLTSNHLDDRVQLFQTGVSDPLLPLDQLGLQNIDFIMCNPPFYDSWEDLEASESSKVTPKPTIFSGAATEIICPGGDAGFILRMIQESMTLGQRVQWYTSALGKFSSVRVIVDKLKEVGCQNWAVSVLRAGMRTKRWVIGWSWGDRRPREDVARGEGLGPWLLPSRTEWVIKTVEKDTATVAKKIDELMQGLDLKWKWEESHMAGVALARENVWSRAARRKKKQQQQQQTGITEEKPSSGVNREGDTDGNGELEKVALGVKITVKTDSVEVRWLRGNDRVVHESFYGIISSAVREVG